MDSRWGPWVTREDKHLKGQCRLRLNLPSSASQWYSSPAVHVYVRNNNPYARLSVQYQHGVLPPSIYVAVQGCARLGSQRCLQLTKQDVWWTDANQIFKSLARLVTCKSTLVNRAQNFNNSSVTHRGLLHSVKHREQKSLFWGLAETLSPGSQWSDNDSRFDRALQTDTGTF